MGVKKRTGGKKSKSLASTKKKVTQSLSAKRRVEMKEKSVELKNKVVLHSGLRALSQFVFTATSRGWEGTAEGSPKAGAGGHQTC